MVNWLVFLLLSVLAIGCSSAPPPQDQPVEPVANVQQKVCSRLWTTVSAGADHTCATTDDGRLYCWGYNNVGQVSSTLDEEVLTPLMVFTQDGGATKVSAKGNHTCALAYGTEGKLWCWGDNTNKTVGDPNHNPVWNPYHVVTGVNEPVKDVSVGVWNTCFIDANNDLYCWGKQQYCQTGTYSSTDTISPTLAPNQGGGDTWPQNVASVTVQYGTVCGVGTDGSARCWGRNAYRMLGNDSSVSYSCTPVDPSIPFSNVSSVSAGLGVTCWLDGDNSYHPYCVGYNYYGELGRGSFTTTSPYYLSPPGAVGGDVTEDTLELDVGYGYNMIARQYNNRVYTWGYGGSGAIGNGTWNNYHTPQLVNVGGSPMAASHVSAGIDHNCAVKTDGTVLYCWGKNNHGQLGDNSKTNRNTPISIPCP